MNLFFSKQAQLYKGLFLFLALAIMAGCDSDSSQTSSQVDSGQDSEDAFREIVLELDSNSYLDELSEEELQTLCEWMVEIQGGPHTVDCGGGISVTIDPIDECLDQPYWPHCRVGLHEQCVRSQARDLCAVASPECEDFYACVYNT